jgi:L(+)-tartrate dehydratase alpha subunit
MVVATHVEVAATHTGGMPVGIHQFCLSSRRATARIHPGGRVEFRPDPEWFTDYYRRDSIE